MNVEELTINYWRFYLMLEKKFIETTRYVELTENNFNTYSLEYVSLLREIGSEIDVIMKALSDFSSKDRSGITRYARKILKDYPEIIEEEIEGNGILIRPFQGWDVEKASQSLNWWNAYNALKHGRIHNFREANLKNVFYSLGALFILNNYLLHKHTQAEYGMMYFDEVSNIFRLIKEKLPIEIIEENMIR